MIFLMALPCPDKINLYYLKGSNVKQDLERKNLPLLRKYCRQKFDYVLFMNEQVFQSRLVLASPEAATDGDYAAILGVIGHEVYHIEVSVFLFQYVFVMAT